METFKPINFPGDLPPLGRLAEDLLLDFKAIKGGGQPEWEMAKDITAFANARGGVLLIGAVEVKGELVDYALVAFDKARQISEDYQRAIKVRCRPMPMIDPKVIEKEKGRYAVAVNVFSYPAPPIGVRALKSEGTNGAKEAWSFPTRRGDGTHYLVPEELSTVMDPVYRRKTLLVEQIPTRVDGSRPVYMHFVDIWKLLYEKGARTSAKPCPQYQMSIVKIDAYRGVIYAKADRASSVVLPLDAVQSVWLDHSRVEFQIAIKGALVDEGGELRFFPT